MSERDLIEMLLTHWREELADYPLNTPAAQRLRVCIEELEQTLNPVVRSESYTVEGSS